MNFRIEEPFRALFPEAHIGPAPGEVVYADDAGIVCRAWNWRASDRAKLTHDTTRAVLVIEALPPRISADLLAACGALASLTRDHLGATCRVALLGGNGVFETSLDA